MTSRRGLSGGLALAGGPAVASDSEWKYAAENETAANAARLRVVQLGIAFVLPFLGVHFVNYCQPGCKVTPIYLDLTPE